MSVDVSVVVPTAGRPALLARCLAALAEQDLPAERFEVIVADNAPSDETRAVVERFAEARGGRFRYLRANGTPGPAAARNRGWRAARGEVIAFTDDDCIPAACWLRAGLGVFADGVAGVEGRVVVPGNGRPPTDYERNAAALETSRFVTASCFYRRDALAAVGGFDERFALAWREDSDLYFRMLERGLRLESAPAAVVSHPVRPAGFGVSLGQQRKSFYNALLYKKHPRLYRELLQPSPRLAYYASVAAVLAALLAAATGRKHAAVMAGLGWATLTARFAAARLSGTARTPTHVAEMILTSAAIPPLSLFWRLAGALRFRTLFL